MTLSGVAWGVSALVGVLFVGLVIGSLVNAYLLDPKHERHYGWSWVKWQWSMFLRGMESGRR